MVCCVCGAMVPPGVPVNLPVSWWAVQSGLEPPGLSLGAVVCDPPGVWSDCLVGSHHKNISLSAFS